MTVKHHWEVYFLCQERAPEKMKTAGEFSHQNWTIKDGFCDVKHHRQVYYLRRVVKELDDGVLMLTTKETQLTTLKF